MQKSSRLIWFVAPLWAIAAGAGVALRPILPIDETRYVAVAWEMWNTGNYLVPHLNGEVYSHKPPLLFWLINVAWAIFGVHGWAAQLVGPTFALLDFFLIAKLAQTLWPDDDHAPAFSGFALLSFPLFAVFASLVMFDAMLLSFVLIGLIGIIRASRPEAGWGSCAWLAIGIGGGILAKGPVVFVYFVPVAMAAPWWSATARSAWKLFAGKLALGLVGGAAIALAWVIPAAILGGQEYREAILWTQTAGRMTQSFAHRRPFWFYVALLPAVLFPWLYWRSVVDVIRREMRRDEGLKFCAVWFAGSLILLSFISGKQVHYLLPILPAIALIAARAGSVAGATPTGSAAIPFLYVILGIGIGIAIFALPNTLEVRLEPNVGAIGLLVCVVAAAVVSLRRRATMPYFFLWSTASCVVFTVSIHWMASTSLHKNYDLTPFAFEIAKLQDAQKPVAHRGVYHGQYQFLGRLQKNIPVIRTNEELVKWCEANPDGYFIRSWPPGEDPYPGKTTFTRRFAGRVVGLVHADAALTKPPSE